jgi:triosephosphate isomerase
MVTPTVDYPLLLVNLKTYRESLGERAVSLSKVSRIIAQETGICVALAPQYVDIRMVARSGVPVFAQHVDPITPGRNTGHSLPEAAADAGCTGTLINHSEKQLPIDTIKAVVDRVKEVGLVAVVCVDTPDKAGKVASFRPDAIAIEPPELIGTGIPVSKAKPEIVLDSVEAVKAVNPKVRILCGAGITSGEDVRAALSLGAEGILVASGVVKAGDPGEKLRDLAESMSG